MPSHLHDQRLDAVLRAVRDCRPRTLIDLGCGEGDLLTHLLDQPGLERIIGIDHAPAALEQARLRLQAHQDEATGTRIELVLASMTERDVGPRGVDCALLIETIEHIAPNQLSRVEQVLFDHLRPTHIIITTPNADYNGILGVPPERFRHPGHRFEWGRAKFRQWSQGIAHRHGYEVACTDIAGLHPLHGGASQMARFTRRAPT
ncbi:hypothetical protein CKO25_06570 [Thiocapsa imhoffii]|uniref:Small RNA 2'-O-methyltransferase n=1 Tax=Thiocapsa imhoffii TaxID=382777 RepID=A0A9X0WGV8_9GAMM|nr:methyltransferase domain-containing protein [Thiocapsa imhoffii]MBK1644323.1 hypothetical protein [Thiocapsa imhoffii]